MSKAQTAAHEILHVIPLLMRVVAYQLRQSGHLPARAHFEVLYFLTEGPHNLSNLADKLNVSLPTMSNSISSLVEHGYVRRTRAPHDRRQVIIEMTEPGLEILKTMETHAITRIAEILDDTNPDEIEKLIEGLCVLQNAFSKKQKENLPLKS